MDEKKDLESVPYFVHEGAVARMERVVKRLWVALIVTVLLMFATNALWLYEFTQYDFETYEYSQDGRGINIIGDGNGVDYGAAAEDTESGPSWRAEGKGVETKDP